MQNRVCALETAYSDLLAALWDELEDLLEAHYGGGRMGGAGSTRLRLKLADVRLRVTDLLQQAEARTREAGGRQPADSALQSFGRDMLRLLDAQLSDEDFELSCGTTLVVVQNRILDEAQRLARAR